MLNKSCNKYRYHTNMSTFLQVQSSYGHLELILFLNSHWSFLSCEMGMGQPIFSIVGRARYRGTHWIWLTKELETFRLSNEQKWRILTSHNPGMLMILVQYVHSITWSYTLMS